MTTKWYENFENYIYVWDVLLLPARTETCVALAPFSLANLPMMIQSVGPVAGYFSPVRRYNLCLPQSGSMWARPNSSAQRVFFAWSFCFVLMLFSLSWVSSGLFLPLTVCFLFIYLSFHFLLSTFVSFFIFSICITFLGFSFSVVFSLSSVFYLLPFSLLLGGKIYVFQLYEEFFRHANIF